MGAEEERDRTHERARLHERLLIVAGTIDALERIDVVNHAIRDAATKADALAALQHPPFDYSPVVATYVLDLQLRRQTAQARADLAEERRQLAIRIAELDAGGS